MPSAGSELEFRADRVVGEEPLEIRAAGPGQDPVAVAVTMRTPGYEDELAVGFLRTEGLIEGPEVAPDRAPAIPAEMNQPDDQSPSGWRGRSTRRSVAERHFVATASCGICGKASLDEVAVRSDPLPPGPVVAAHRRPRPAGPAPSRAARVRRDRRAPRGGPVHARPAS